MNSILTDRAKNYTTFLNERMRIWVLQSKMSDSDLAKASGVCRQTIFNFKTGVSNLEHDNLLSVGFAIGKIYNEITQITEEDKKQLDTD